MVARIVKKIPRNSARSSGRVIGDEKRLRQRKYTTPATTAGVTSTKDSGFPSLLRSLTEVISSCDIVGRYRTRSKDRGYATRVTEENVKPFFSLRNVRNVIISVQLPSGRGLEGRGGANVSSDSSCQVAREP